MALKSITKDFCMNKSIILAALIGFAIVANDVEAVPTTRSQEKKAKAQGKTLLVEKKDNPEKKSEPKKAEDESNFFVKAYNSSKDFVVEHPVYTTAGVATVAAVTAAIIYRKALIAKFKSLRAAKAA